MTQYVEYRKDVSGGKIYASRNNNDLRHTFDHPGANRSNLDWNLTLRQVRMKKNINATQSTPNLVTAELSQEGRRAISGLTSEHPDGPYHSNTETVEKYHNVAATGHMHRGGRHDGLTRVSSGTSDMIDFQMGLRDGSHQKTDDQWRRYFSRPQVSFDMMKENCSAENQAYQKCHTTPQDRRPDRRASALPLEMVRDDPISFKRWPGAEGTQVGQWVHLINDRRHGHKSRGQIKAETTMRTQPSDNHGAKICDNRSDGCIVEMLGKKKWVNPVSHEPHAARPPVGDPKLHHLTRHRILPEADEENRAKRIARHPRSDNHISEKHEAVMREGGGGGKKGSKRGSDE